MRDPSITIDHPVIIEGATINLRLQVPKEYVGIDVFFSIEREFNRFVSFCEAAQKERRLTVEEQRKLKALSTENARLSDIYYPAEC
jgi:hypothetical protein